MKKEEILKPSRFCINPNFDSRRGDTAQYDVHEIDALKAMDFFAERECIAFERFLMTNDKISIIPKLLGNPMYYLYEDSYGSVTKKTPEELYQIYKQEK